MNFQDLYDIYQKIIKEKDKLQKKVLISQFIAKFIDSRKEIIESLSTKKNKPFENKPLDDINKYFDYDYDFSKDVDDEKYKFVKLVNEIYVIINKVYFENFIRKDKASLPDIDRKINGYISNTTENIKKKVKELYDFKEKNKNEIKKKLKLSIGEKELTDIEFENVFNENREAFKEIIDYLINSLKKEIAYAIKEYDDKLKKFSNERPTKTFMDDFNSNSIDKYLNGFYNNFVKGIKLSLKEKLYKDKNIKRLLEFFKKTDDDIFIPELKEFDEDFKSKYQDAEAELKKDDPNLKKLEGLFNSKYGDWIVDLKSYPQAKELKEEYDKKVV